jgi:hypothetical protein
LGNTLTISLLKHKVCPHLSNKTGSWTRWSESVQISRTKLGVRPGGQKVSTSRITRSHSQFRSRDVDTFWSPGLTPSFVATWSHSQFRSRDVDTFWPPGLTPSFLSNETGSENRWTGSVYISQVRPGVQKVYKSLERNWEWEQVIRKCTHPSNKTGSETRWSECVHISGTKLGVVSFERYWHILTTWSHSQFRSRDWNTFWSPGLTPSFVREIGTLPDHLVSFPVSFLEM